MRQQNRDFTFKSVLSPRQVNRLEIILPGVKMHIISFTINEILCPSVFLKLPNYLVISRLKVSELPCCCLYALKISELPYALHKVRQKGYRVPKIKASLGCFCIHFRNKWLILKVNTFSFKRSYLITGCFWKQSVVCQVSVQVWHLASHHLSAYIPRRASCYRLTCSLFPQTPSCCKLARLPHAPRGRCVGGKSRHQCTPSPVITISAITSRENPGRETRLLYIPWENILTGVHFGLHTYRVRGEGKCHLNKERARSSVKSSVHRFELPSHLLCVLSCLCVCAFVSPCVYKFVFLCVCAWDRREERWKRETSVSSSVQEFCLTGNASDWCRSSFKNPDQLRRWSANASD